MSVIRQVVQTAKFATPKVVLPALTRSFSVSIYSFNEGIGSNNNNADQLAELQRILKSQGMSTEQSINWYKKLQEESSDTESLQEKLETFEKDIESFNSPEVVENCYPDLQSLVENSIVGYGTKNLKALIEEELAEELDENSEELFNAYTELITSGIEGENLTKNIEERRAVPREEVTEDKVAHTLTKLDSLLEKVFSISENEEIEENDNEGVNEDTLEEIFDTYFEIPEPRARFIPSDTLEGMLALTGEVTKDHFTRGYLSKFSLSISSEQLASIYSDVIDSGLKLSPFEYYKFISLKLDTANEFPQDFYESLKTAVIAQGIPLDTRFYSLYLETCLKTRNFELFELILKEISELKIDLDRRLIRQISTYYATIGDLDRWLTVWDIRMNHYRFTLSREEYYEYIRHLVAMEQREAAKMLVELSVVYREYLKDAVKEARESEESQLEEGEEDSENLYEPLPIKLQNQIVDDLISYEEPFEMIDFIYPVEERRPIMFFMLPESDFAEPLFDKIEDLQELNSDLEMLENCDLEISLSMVENSLIKLNEFETTEESFKAFKSLMSLVFNDEETVKFLIWDEVMITNFNEIVGKLFDNGFIDGNNDDLVEHKVFLDEYVANVHHMDDIEAAREVIDAMVEVVAKFSFVAEIEDMEEELDPEMKEIVKQLKEQMEQESIKGKF